MPIPVLAVDDDPEFHSLLAQVFRGLPAYRLVTARNPAEAVAVARQESFAIALVDLHYSEGPPEGFRLLGQLKELDPAPELVVLSSSRGFEHVRGAMRAGAGDYLPKGFGVGELEHALDLALQRRRWRRIEGRVRQAAGAPVLVGSSAPMRALRERIARFAPAEAPVLITGETGTGKELAAAQLHAGSRDPAGPFVAVNCAALPASTIDSFFFGHERGAFTGADRARGGVFEEADGGTLFLDEVNSLPAELQGRLLRVLQEKKTRRLGGSRELSVDFRLVAATNQDLEKLVKAGTFREDLFFRLGVLRLELPPLRDRGGDVAELCAALLPSRRLEPSLATLLATHAWPGNVRELRNLLQAMDVLAEPGEALEPRHLPDYALRAICAEQAEPALPEDLAGLENEREGRERDFLARAYRSANGNVSAMARLLGLDRSHLHQKLVKLGIHAPRR